MRRRPRRVNVRPRSRGNNTMTVREQRKCRKLHRILLTAPQHSSPTLVTFRPSSRLIFHQVTVRENVMRILYLSVVFSLALLLCSGSALAQNNPSTGTKSALLPPEQAVFPQII